MKKYIDFEMWLHMEMCSHCPYAKKCHDDCEFCDDYIEQYDNEESEMRIKYLEELNEESEV